jgi:MFS family permease
MVDRDNLSNGIMLNSILISTARIFGPTMAGIALVQWGAGWCFFLNGMSFLAVIVGLCFMHIDECKKLHHALPFLKQFKEGLSYSRYHPVIAPLLLLSLVGSIFIVNMITLMPAFADLVLNSPKEGYATLSAAHGFGAVIAGLTASWLYKNSHARGRVVSMTVLFTPVAIWLLAITNTIASSAAVIALCGLGIILQFVTINTLIQSQVPDEFRGRVMSLYTLTFFGIAPFGALLLGLIASYIGTPSALAFYALIGGVLSAAIVWRSPALRQLV